MIQGIDQRLALGRLHGSLLRITLPRTGSFMKVVIVVIAMMVLVMMMVVVMRLECGWGNGQVLVLMATTATMGMVPV